MKTRRVTVNKVRYSCKKRFRCTFEKTVFKIKNREYNFEGVKP